jgi:hypothetical protein
MSPTQADVGLEGVLALCAMFLDCSEQCGYNLRQARRRRRRGGRGPLGAVGGYLGVGPRCEGEALDCR